jgi:hypothetical protein
MLGKCVWAASYSTIQSYERKEVPKEASSYIHNTVTALGPW